jgi:hypothetical protein
MPPFPTSLLGIAVAAIGAAVSARLAVALRVHVAHAGNRRMMGLIVPPFSLSCAA